jgi:hydroxymethylbilane synthase
VSPTRLRVRIATRRSPLARAQADIVARRLGAHVTSLEVELVLVTTSGDERRTEPIRALGGVGAFADAVSRAVSVGRADLAVHSAKDLPVSCAPSGLRIAAVPGRADPRDALVGARLDDLAPGSVVATGSARRRAQLAWLRPDLRFVELRGNIGTRLSRVPPGGAVVVAAAALERLSLSPAVVERLPTSWMLPQVGQGALAVECREDDPRAAELAEALDDPAAHRALDAERAFLRGVGGGCDLPVAAHATDVGGRLALAGLVASADGRVLVRREALGDDPETLGIELAEEVLGRCGGRALLETSPGGGR